jgi:hypothetical protein
MGRGAAQRWRAVARTRGCRRRRSRRLGMAATAADWVRLGGGAAAPAASNGTVAPPPRWTRACARAKLVASTCAAHRKEGRSKGISAWVPRWAAPKRGSSCPPGNSLLHGAAAQPAASSQGEWRAPTGRDSGAPIDESEIWVTESPGGDLWKRRWYVAGSQCRAQQRQRARPQRGGEEGRQEDSRVRALPRV